MRRAGRVLLVVVLTLASTVAHADRFAGLERASHDSSWRVRLQAAYVLSRQHDPRVVRIFQRLLNDDNESVRSVAASALARLRPPTKPQPSRVATRPGLLHISIGGIGAKSKTVPKDMTRQLRMLLEREFAKTPGLMLDGEQVTGFLIDSSITALNRRVTRDWVEVTCEISVVVGRLPSKAMVMMTSGGATVQEPKAEAGKGRATSLEADALEGAVKGAHENLLVYLHAQR